MSKKAPAQQLIKDTAALKHKKFRDEHGCILVEGRHPIEEALRAGLTLRTLFLGDGQSAQWPQADWPNEQAYVVSSAVLARMGSTSSPPPCLAVFDAPSAPRAISGELVLVLDTIQDPGNLGTLIRSAVAFGVDSVLLIGSGAEPDHPKVIRSSAGLIFALPVLQLGDQDLADWLPSPTWRVYTTTGSPGAMDYRQADYRGACAIVLGNEGQGVSDDLLPAGAATPLTIPMAARVESLNVGVSGSIILAQAAASRRTSGVSSGGQAAGWAGGAGHA